MYVVRTLTLINKPNLQVNVHSVNKSILTYLGCTYLRKDIRYKIFNAERK